MAKKKIVQKIASIMTAGMKRKVRLRYHCPKSNIEPTKYQFDIALIAMNIPEDYFQKSKMDSGLKPVKIKSKYAGKVKDIMLKNIRKAHKAGASIICCSEYSFAELHKDALSKPLLKLSHQKNTYIFAGSYAQTMNKNERSYNICPVYIPTREQPFEIYKNQPGYIKGDIERIDTPTGNTINVFNTEYGKIACLICYDIDDDDALHNLILANYEASIYQPLDIILVPAYNSDPTNLHERCKYTSEYTGTCVIYVSDLTFGSQCKVYVNGHEESPATVKSSSHDGQVHIYTLDLAKLRNERREQQQQLLTKWSVD